MPEIPKYLGWAADTIPVLDPELAKDCTKRALEVAPKRPMNFIAGCLTPRRHQALYYLALNMDYQQIATQMAIKPTTLNSTLAVVFPILDAHSRTEASLKGIAIGALSLTQLVTQEEQDLVRAQSTGKKGELLKRLIQNYGRNSTNPEIASDISSRPGYVEQLMSDILGATNIVDRARLAIVRFSLD